MPRPSRTLVAAACLHALSALAHDGPPASSLVEAHRACDRVVLEARVRATPERRLVILLAEGSRAERMAVLRGAAGADDPVALLAPIARLMAGSDPELAPAAAQALARIVPALSPAALREHTLDEVAEALAPALALADNRGARDDLRQVSRLLRAMVPAPAIPPLGARRPRRTDA